MNEAQEIYLGLLRAALWGDNGERLAIRGEQLNDVIRIAAIQGTGPLVYDQLLKRKDMETPAELRMLMKQQCVHSMMLQQSMIPLLSQAWNALVVADIHPILLKGFCLARHYPRPHLRQWGDIDIYVGQQNYHKACTVLRDAFPDSEYQEMEEEEEKTYNFEFSNTMIEIHRVSMTFAHPRDRRYYEFLEKKCLTKDGPKNVVEGLAVTMPEETFNIFFVFLHAWHHFMGTGMNMKLMCDIAILLHAKREVINKDRLHEMLHKLYLMEVWQLVMYIMMHYLGVPREECLFYEEKSKERAELLFERIMQEGSSYRREHISTEGLSYIQRKYSTFQLRMADSKRVRPFSPRYARHLFVSNILHGLERAIKRK